MNVNLNIKDLLILYTYRVETFPWRCNDKDVQELIELCTTLHQELERIKEENKRLVKDSISHANAMQSIMLTEMLKNAQAGK